MGTLAVLVPLAAAATVVHHLNRGSRAQRAAAIASTHSRAARLSRQVSEPVIVILRSQFLAHSTDRHANSVHVDLVRAAQAPLLRQLRASNATNVKSFSLVDAVSATVSARERAALSHNAEVKSVVPDSTITVGVPASRTQAVSRSRGRGHGRIRSDAATAPASPALNTIPNACSSNPNQPQLDSEGLSLTNTDSMDPKQPTARSLGITGAGVKVAFIADNMDPNNINFKRANGSSAFSDYQDFAGHGVGQQSAGGEGFLDANQIAGQGIHVYNVGPYSPDGGENPCYVRIEGVAPGASLVGLNAFDETPSGTYETFESNFLQAINYAVENDNVNVINESFGSNYFPDVTALDTTKLFNDAAVAAGVTVSVSSGDAGPFNTIGTPSTDPSVISVGASTDDRFYAQTNYGAARYFATSGWLDDNISALSSSGEDETGDTVNLVAPGELSWASCTATQVAPKDPQYSDCAGYTNQPSDVEESGGTSEAAPFVSGAAALVIQAYRQTHGGANPTPALVKQILTSSATDLGAPADEQGAGLLNSYKAVELAESIGTSTPVGNTLTTSVSSLTGVGEPGTPEHWNVAVTNTGQNAQTVSLAGRTFGADQNIQGGTVTLKDGTSPEFQYVNGAQDNYEVVHFTVPAGQNRLTTQLAYPGSQANCIVYACEEGLNQRVRIALITPSGQYATETFAQGPGNYGNADVRQPAAGQWTGIIYGIVAADGGTNGTVTWSAATQQYAPFANVQPSSLTLAPGQTQSFSVATTTPSTPGDAAGSVDLTTSAGDTYANPADPALHDATTSIPVTLRSLVSVAGNGWGGWSGWAGHGRASGSFSGTMTGGNGRAPGEGQDQYYEFNVPRGVHDVTANLALANDPSDPVGLELVSPDGDVLGYGQNTVGGQPGGLNGTPELSATANTLNPQPGTWTLIAIFAEAPVGNELSDPYTGTITFNSTQASAPGLPQGRGARITSGNSLTVPVKVTNTGQSAEEYFVDPRLDGYTPVTLTPLTFGTSTLPLPLANGEPEWLVPTETSGVSLGQTATVPAVFDFGFAIGDPDISSSSPGAGYGCSKTESASYAPDGGSVTAGVWFAGPDECGPYTGQAPTGSVTDAMTATTRAFDANASSSTGDLWQQSYNPSASFSPLLIQPGQTGTIDVTLTASGQPGSRVSGDLYIDDYDSDTPPAAVSTFSGSEVTSLPYSYRVVAPRRHRRW